MNFVRANIKWIMLVSGALTFTMVYAAIAPQEALRSFFGETIEGPLAEIIVRNWGALVALVGALLIYGAFYPPVRSVVLVVAGRLLYSEHRFLTNKWELPLRLTRCGWRFSFGIS